MLTWHVLLHALLAQCQELHGEVPVAVPGATTIGQIDSGQAATPHLLFRPYRRRTQRLRPCACGSLDENPLRKIRGKNVWSLSVRSTDKALRTLRDDAKVCEELNAKLAKTIDAVERSECESCVRVPMPA